LIRDKCSTRTKILVCDLNLIVSENHSQVEGLATIRVMVGGIAIAVILLLSPFLITLSLVAIAALLGNSLKDDAESRHEGSSLIETNY
jgi:hypothetical protein|tara:strand:- start:11 stop:274 length:264 start_codon:yes stop_codon:yes gene_type:complete